jgi:hypothetical protein
MLQTTNYFVNIHPEDYNPITHPILRRASLATNTIIHGAVWFNVQMLLCTNHHTSNHAQNKALLEGMFAAWVEERKEWNEAAVNCSDSIKDRDNLNFEICDVHFVSFGMQAFFSELDIQNLPFTTLQSRDWLEITQPFAQKSNFVNAAVEDVYTISLPHARATVLSNASKFFKLSELPLMSNKSTYVINEELIYVWDSHQNAEMPVRIAHNGTIGCLVDKNGKVRKKAEFGYKTKEAFLLEIQNSKQ